METYRWLFEDRRTGRIVVGQSPNVLMLVFVGATAGRFAARQHGVVGTVVRRVQAGSLFLWAADEVLRGVNPFRRLGGAILILAVPFRKLLR